MNKLGGLASLLVASAGFLGQASCDDVSDAMIDERYASELHPNDAVLVEGLRVSVIDEEGRVQEAIFRDIFSSDSVFDFGTYDYFCSAGGRPADCGQVGEWTAFSVSLGRHCFGVPCDENDVGNLLVTAHSYGFEEPSPPHSFGYFLFHTRDRLPELTYTIKTNLPQGYSFRINQHIEDDSFLVGQYFGESRESVWHELRDNEGREQFLEFVVSKK